MEPLFHISPQGKKLAYRKTHQLDNTGQLTKNFVWLSGFKSDMSGSKVLELEAWAKRKGHGFLAFDYSGHGLSEGEFIDGTIGEWRADVLTMLDDLTEGPQIIVGSSMGGWMALLAALARPEKVAGLVLIAPAPDFTEKLMWPDLEEWERAKVLGDGVYYQPSEYDEPLPLTRALFEDGRAWQIMDESIHFDGPVRILQGVQDRSVPYQHAQSLVDRMTGSDIVYQLIKDGDHRLSRPQDIARLIATCTEICEATQT